MSLERAARVAAHQTVEQVRTSNIHPIRTEQRTITLPLDDWEYIAGVLEFHGTPAALTIEQKLTARLDHPSSRQR